ncbi:MAG TPA: hypothetical protein VG297_16295 [Bryobacteraceae bacterium]|nr:hypothetical protein [Bryobacteraceae bacterium]
MLLHKNILIAGGILLLAGVGAAAWIHSSQNNTVSASTALPYAASDQAAATAPGPADGYYPSVPAPVYVRQGEVPPPEPAYESAPPPTASYRAYSERPRRSRHHGRSKKHSVEIVAGTAAAGAAIGAIAGGGPGAAIGAISGGGAGFVYDRLTHNH